VCFGTRGIVLCQSRDDSLLLDAYCVLNSGGKGNEGVGRKKGYIYSSSCEYLVQLVRYDNFDSFPAFCWLTNTKRPSLNLAQPPGTPAMRILEKRFSPDGEDCFQCWALLSHLAPLSPLRARTSRSILRRSQVVLTVQPSNAATRMPSGGVSTRN